MQIPLDTSSYKKDALLAQYNKLRRLNSPHLPALLGLGRHRTSEPTFPFVVMEFVVGAELADWHPGKPLRKSVDILASVAETLAALGTPHGDLTLKETFSFLTTTGVVLIDPDADEFGSLRSDQPRSGRT